jgi:hypothetical protein
LYRKPTKKQHANENNMDEQTPKEGNLYDKIFKENAERIFLPLIEEALGIRIAKFLPLRAIPHAVKL